ncbi:MAG: hypothetical protein LBO62_04695, partial [Endomicrobium sp.]|nr:hypothetical protein [Endomicrobium sp.]
HAELVSASAVKCIAKTDAWTHRGIATTDNNKRQTLKQVQGDIALVVSVMLNLFQGDVAFAVSVMLNLFQGDVAFVVSVMLNLFQGDVAFVVSVMLNLFQHLPLNV